MTEPAKAGSVPVDPAAGNLTEQPKTPEKGSAGENGKTWLDGLSEGNRKLAETKGWNTPESLDKAFTAYTELERMQGESLRVPAADAPKEEWDKFYSKKGRPESADKYEFKRPEGLPADLPYSADLANASKTWLHGVGLNQREAQIVHDGFVTFAADKQKAEMARVAKSVEDTHDGAVKEWGPKEGEVFKTKHTLADRAINKLGLLDVFKRHGILTPDGAVTDLQVLKSYAEVGDSMFREDTIDANGGARTLENPFKRNADGKIDNPDAISALIKSDPERAKRMAREAGEPYSNWVTANPL